MLSRFNSNSARRFKFVYHKLTNIRKFLSFLKVVQYSINGIFRAFAAFKSETSKTLSLKLVSSQTSCISMTWQNIQILPTLSLLFKRFKSKVMKTEINSAVKKLSTSIHFTTQTFHFTFPHICSRHCLGKQMKQRYTTHEFVGMNSGRDKKTFKIPFILMDFWAFGAAIGNKCEFERTLMVHIRRTFPRYEHVNNARRARYVMIHPLSAANQSGNGFLSQLLA